MKMVLLVSIPVMRLSERSKFMDNLRLFAVLCSVTTSSQHFQFLGGQARGAEGVLGTHCNCKDFYFYFSPAKSGAAG